MTGRLFRLRATPQHLPAVAPALLQRVGSRSEYSTAILAEGQIRLAAIRAGGGCKPLG